jgi:hypothetical protein
MVGCLRVTSDGSSEATTARSLHKPDSPIGGMAGLVGRALLFVWAQIEAHTTVKQVSCRLAVPSGKRT